jgi:ankyrin repeat protein
MDQPISIHLAAAQGDLVTVKTLLEQDKRMVNSTEPKFSNTPLHLAAWFNHAHVIPTLIDAGADVSKTNQFGSTPIHSAAWRNSSATLKELLEYNASAIQANTTGIGNTPIYLAAKAGSTDCVRILLHHLHTNLSRNSFIMHLNQKCAGDNSTTVQVAGVRQHAQCYWDLTVAGGDYMEKSLSLLTKENEFNSESINNNNTVKSFIAAIEKNGKDNPPRYNGASTFCFKCNIDYKHNDVVMTLTQCDHSCHVYCFEDLVLEQFITKNKESALIKKSLENGSLHDAKHELRTNPLVFIRWNWVNTCPECTQPTLVDDYGKLSVFLNEKEAT